MTILLEIQISTLQHKTVILNGVFSSCIEPEKTVNLSGVLIGPTQNFHPQRVCFWLDLAKTVILRACDFIAFGVGFRG
jgi:hypothetical protein